MQIFFNTIASLDRFSLSLDSRPQRSECKHCHQRCAWTSHGFVYKQRTIAEREPVGKRVLCSNRHGKKGCGRTVQLYLTTEIPGRHYGASALFLFLSALLAGSSVSDAYHKVVGDRADRQGWRWLTQLMACLSDFRRRLSLTTDHVGAFAHRCRRLQILLPTVQAMLPNVSQCPCAAYQMQTQTGFFDE